MEVDSELFLALRRGDRAALGRAITLVESERATDLERANQLVEQCLPYSGKSLRLGITGIPGVGKSTLIDALGMSLIAKGHRVAVLAIDPSSSRTGGSILGDKTRMDRLARSDHAFVRPTAAAGNLGGVARRTQEAILLCEAAGYDRIIVETVGTGQSELEVDHMTDLNLLLMIAGTGDELQGIKRGIMESADLIAFNKADGAMRQRAEAARSDLRSAIALLPVRPSGRPAELVLTSGLTGEGVDALIERIEALSELDARSGYTDARRREQGVHWLERSLTSGLRDIFDRDERIAAALAGLKEAVHKGTKTPFAAAGELLRAFRTTGGPLP